MCSPCPRSDRLAPFALLACLVLAVPGCNKEKRDYHHKGPLTTPSAEAVRIGELQPGALEPQPPSAKAKEFEGNAWHANNGQHLYKAFNCNGCHAAGGGGIGPALMDADWRYGGSMDQIHATISQGRPNRMPSFRGKIPDDQIWEIAAYVRTLSGNAPKYVAGGATEGMAATPPTARMKKQPPKTAESAQ
jgi:cytochrome c oxidase cbb3-type subunit 3